MTDHFAALGFAPSPLIEEEALQSAFETLSRKLHPDVAGGDPDAFRALNAARQILRDPAKRLRHLLELRAPDLLARSTAPEAWLTELFMQAGGLVQKLEAFQTRERSATSPLARALLAPEKMDLVEGLLTVTASLDRAHAETLELAAALAPAWEEPAHLQKIPGLQQRLLYLGKWSETLRAKMFDLNI